MKKTITVVLLTVTSTVAAQWSNTNNYFEDSLAMPVTTAPLSQRNPIVLTSYPDGGYFVIWEDDRNFTTAKTDIYAQKYDNAGNRLWAADGVPIANGANSQHYSFSSNQDYRGRSFAATDSAGGFYITYSDDSVSNYYWERVTVQHVRSNGSTVFPAPGYIIATSGAANLAMSAQLIADGNRGFYVAYKQVSGNEYIHAYCFRDEGGSLKLYGGGRMNENAIQTSSIAPCGIKTDVVYPGTNVAEFNIWGDGQGGCNVIMNMNGNIGGQGRMLTYNQLWRAKKDSKTRTFFRNTSGAACPRIAEYSKGDVYIMYTLKTDYQTVACGGGGGPVYTYTNYRLISNGYQLIDIAGYDYAFPKGVNVASTGNISINMMAAARRTYSNNTLSDFILYGYAYPVETFDSIPYQHTSYSNPDFGYNTSVPSQVAKLIFFRDTLLAASNYYPDFSIAGGSSGIYAAALMSTSGSRVVRLQHLSVTAAAADSFAIEYDTEPGAPNKNGVAIGREQSTGFSGSDIYFDYPIVRVSSSGRAFFYIKEGGRFARVSPIVSGTQLLWGAMGRPAGTGVYNNAYYSMEQPVVAFDAAGENGIIAWRDGRFIPGNTGDNIYMRHLGRLDALNYSPPPRRVKLLPNPYGATAANPAVLLGSSRQYSMIEAYSSYGSDPGASPILNIMDNNNLGRMQIGLFQHSTAIRKYNGIAYLNRNYTILSENDASGKTIDLLLYFTKEEFNALQAADVTIADPGYLTVIHQPNASNTTPNAYLPAAGQEILSPITWDSVNGGYFVKVIATGLGDFFIQKMPAATLCPGAGTSFSANITGAAYQWQVNTGSNFFDISNDANYSGTNTATLHISNTPSSFSGYRYRCVVDNLKVSHSFYLQAANTWTGAVNQLWENAGNWSCGVVPDEHTDVMINSGTVTVNSNVTCRSIKVNPGATVSVTPGFSITVTN